MPTAERYQQYELLRREDGSFWELGRGAMGITYKAYDTNLRFAVALKVINSAYLESETARQRFVREARAAAALRHPNVASVFNLGTDHENYFYVMEFIDGETVEARVRRDGPLQPAVALNIALQVSRALAVAARQQLVHRDLKPTNLMLVDQEEELTVKVIDFGLAKVAKDVGEDSGALTMGGFVGTPHFASPEQIEEGEVDIRSDIYSLGATLYFVLTGQAPFTGSIGQIMSQHLYKPLPMAQLSSLPACVGLLVQRMMEKDRNGRPQTAQELQRGILACLDEIRTTSGASGKAGEPTSTTETLDLTFASGQPLATGIILAQTYRLVEEFVESPHGRKFLADDLRHNRQANLLVFSPEFLADRSSFSALQEAVGSLRKAPHKMLREVYSLETFSDCSFLVEEYVVGISLLDLLRRRGALTAPEVCRLLNLLAPLADHATKGGLQHVDFALSGIHLLERSSTRSGIPPDVLRQSLIAWESLDAKVDAINFSFSPDHTGTWAGMATRMQGDAQEGPQGSYARLLSLLAYELLGGPRARLSATGQYSPVASLTREGNAVLRRGVIDDFPSAGELARQLAIASGVAPLAPSPETKERVVPELPRRTPSSVPSPPVQEPLRRSPSSVPLPSESKDRAAQEPLRRTPSSIPLSPGSKDRGAQELLRRSPSSVPPESKESVAPESLPRTPPSKPPPEGPIKGRFRIPIWLWALALVLIALVFGLRLLLWPPQVPEIAALSVRTEPSGAILLLDGKPPQLPPDTFTHVPLGTHQLSATLDKYEPIKQDVQVRAGMNPEIHLQLTSIPEIAALSVRTEPAGASLLLDGKPPQVPPNTFTHVPFGPHRLSATLDNYEPVAQDIQVRKGMTPEVRLQLKPTQEIAALAVQTEPTGASILLDGKPPQVPPNTFTHVPFGPHQLSATLDNYEPFTMDLQVRPGMSPELRLQLKPSLEILALTIQTEPAGAAILLDGRPPQVSPNTFTHVPFGTHRLSATLDNYEPIEQEVQIRRGMPEIRLELKPSQEIAALSIQTEPTGAAILLDGRTPQVPPNTFTHVPFGPHQLSATLDNYEPFKQDLQVRRGMNPEVHLELKPSQEIAALSVQTAPSGAAILLDGKPPQVPPNTFTHVPFGPHQLSATLDNYEPFKQDLQVRRGMNPEIRLELKLSQDIAALSVQTEPSGAAILLDGKPPQIPPNTFTHVPFGPHQLSATLDNYEPFKQDLQVRRGMNPEVRLELKQIQEIATLSVQTEPSGAAILLDGKPPQVPPRTFTHVPFGTHRLSATLDNYEPLEQDLQVRRGMNPEVRLELTQIQEIAALSVQTEPTGASILLDGKPPQVLPNTFIHVPFGSHQLSATLDGYEPIKQDIQARKGMNTGIRLQFKRSQEIATLSVQTEPAGATTLLDGKPPQVPPNTFTHVSFGTHQLSAILDGYEPLKQDLEVREGSGPEMLFYLKPTDETEHANFASLLQSAQLGDSSAMMKVGRLFFKKGTPKDDIEGFNWLLRAYTGPNTNLEAGTYLADCYLTGRGTKQDLPRAEELTMTLANQNVVLAMTLAGRILQIKAAIKRTDAEKSASPQIQNRLITQANDLDRQARQWWERAEKGDWNASAHLANCYEIGSGGLEKNEAEAEKRYRAGVDHGNALSMLFYGLMIQKKPGRRIEAQNLIGRAAALGFPLAIKWCKDNNVSFGDKRTNEGQQ
jgi:serine/threonine protein kinase/TPR repeat protein/chaperone required for assembly of F1-ATPase